MLPIIPVEKWKQLLAKEGKTIDSTFDDLDGFFAFQYIRDFFIEDFQKIYIICGPSLNGALGLTIGLQLWNLLNKRDQIELFDEEGEGDEEEDDDNLNKPKKPKTSKDDFKGGIPFNKLPRIGRIDLGKPRNPDDENRDNDGSNNDDDEEDNNENSSLELFDLNELSEMIDEILAQQEEEFVDTKVSVIFNLEDEKSEIFNTELSNYLEAGGYITPISSIADMPLISNEDLVIDCMFGAELEEKLSGLYEQLAKHINELDCRVVALDLPSGLPSDRMVNPNETVLYANDTLTILGPKLSLMLSEHKDIVGKVEVVETDETLFSFENIEDTIPAFYLEEDDVADILSNHHRLPYLPKKELNKVYLYGPSSIGQSGKTIFAARAAIAGGAGDMDVFCKEEAITSLSINLPEADIFNYDNIEAILAEEKYFKAMIIGLGANLGSFFKFQKNLALLKLAENRKPIFTSELLNELPSLQADVLAVLKGACLLVNTQAINTFKGRELTHQEQLELIKELAYTYEIFVVLIGAFTALAKPSKHMYFTNLHSILQSSARIEEMVAGTIAGLMAQDCALADAVMIAPFLLSEAAAEIEDEGRYTSTPNDILSHLPIVINNMINGEE